MDVDYIQQIVCSAASENVAEAAVEEIENILRVSHKIPEGGENNFLIGGVIGLSLGVGLSYIVAFAMSLLFIINPIWMVISFVSCAILGLISGFFPALKASRTDPINALRYE